MPEQHPLDPGLTMATGVLERLARLAIDNAKYGPESHREFFQVGSWWIVHAWKRILAEYEIQMVFERAGMQEIKELCERFAKEVEAANAR